MNQRLGVAVVGCGIGRAHVEEFQRLGDRFEVLAICDVDEAKARDLASVYGIPRVTTDLSALCRMDDLDVIDLCTPPHLHFAQIQETLEAGKHVICEKPLVGSIKAVDDLVLAEARSGRRVMPISQYRFGHGLQKLKLLVEQGLAGRAYLATVEIAWRRRADYYAVPWRGRWRTELGGNLMHHAIHFIDMLAYILGPAKRVSAHITTRVNPVEVEDCAAVALEFADGALATLAATTGSSAQISRQRFCFSGFSAESNTQPYQSSHDPWTFTGDSPELTERIDAALARFVARPEGFEEQFYRFHDALHHGTELPVTLADARVALEIITAIYTSAQTGQAVDLPIDREHPSYAGWLHD